MNLILKHKLFFIFLFQSLLTFIISLKIKEIESCEFIFFLFLGWGLYITYKKVVVFLIFYFAICIDFTLSFYPHLKSDFEVDYQELSSFSGEPFLPKHSHYRYNNGIMTEIPPTDTCRRSCSPSSAFLYLDNGDIKMRFISNIVFTQEGNEELNLFFGKKGTEFLKGYTWHSEKIPISVKYKLTPLPFKPAMFNDIIANRLLIYELSIDNKIIYDYNYFINKYNAQQKRIYIFIIYLIISSLRFMPIYANMDNRNKLSN